MDAQPAGLRPAFRKVLILLVLLAGAALWMLREHPDPSPADLTDDELVAMHPLAEPPTGHTRASDCRECHRHNHDTWHASFHRTMTQLVTPESARADFNNVRINFPRVREKFLLHRRDGMPWVTFDENVATFPIDKLKRKTFPLLLSTGSHHLQYYWAPMGRGRTMAQLPVVYLFEARRWIPVNSSFITPPGGNAHGAGSTWNESCLECHATFPEPRPTGEFLEYDTRVAEFGIGCESCHGPGAEHIRLHRNHPEGLPAGADPIVDPAGLSASLSAQVCAGCHSVFDQKPWRAHRPGEPLAKDRKLKTRAGMVELLNERMADAAEEQKQKALLTMDSWFWPDGQSRVTGREYNNLLESACHTAGGMSCLNCHRMHQDRDDPRPLKEWANDQLAYERHDDEACVKCHQPRQYASPAHTHHAIGSSGSRCYNCHMPHTTYGLLQAIRSHTISSPDAAASRSTGRPTACNLCHLDRSLAWTAERLHEWYDAPQPRLDADDQVVSQVVRLLLEGDAAQRAIAAWALAWPPAVNASGGDWIAPLLSRLLDDPYPAVRFMAERSLRAQPGFADWEYDFLGAPSDLESAVAAATEHWRAMSNDTNAPARPAVLLHQGRRLDAGQLTRLHARRNDRPIMIAE